MSLLNDINTSYMAIHVAKENAFWKAKMNLAGYVDGTFEQLEGEYRDYISDASKLPDIEQELQRTDISEEQRIGLEGWKKFFEVNSISDPKALKLVKELIALEGALETKRRDMNLGYIDPETGEFVATSSVKLGLMLGTHDDERYRKAAWEGLASIEPFVLEHGFVDIVKKRNELARALGYSDYYDYKVNINEGFDKATLFGLLDDLESKTADACSQLVDAVAKEKGESAREPWNFGYYTAGDLTRELDPYFRFEDSCMLWGKTFAALGVSYQQANMSLDLVQRKGKYENGFMHGPVPGYVRNGEKLPSTINFTANAVPGQLGSGKRALETFLHEGGHAAHFANIAMPAPCFAQEFAPTSVAFAETQSMYMDAFTSDAMWLTRYAKNVAGEAIPRELIEKQISKEQRMLSYRLRSMLAVCYAEKELYEMSDAEMTPEKILSTIRRVETAMSKLRAGARPLLSVPHLLSNESSAYYHGYVLAQMAVFQTREYFREKYGHNMDNRHVGEELTEAYWKPGNSKTFLQFVEDLTGKPFSADPTARQINMTAEEVSQSIDEDIAKESTIPHFADNIDLEATIRIVHGDETICSTETDSFETVANKFSTWVSSLS